MLDWFFLLFTASQAVEVPKTYYTGLVAAEAAYAAMLPDPLVDNRVERNNCKVCAGTGRVKSGDGQGWTKCDNCKPPATEIRDTPTPAKVPPAMQLQSRPLKSPQDCGCGIYQPTSQLLPVSKPPFWYLLKP